MQITCGTCGAGTAQAYLVPPYFINNPFWVLHNTDFCFMV
jgi:hypothetical protein